MSRSRRNSPGRTKEYWKSRLHRWGEIRGPFTKKLTHRKERHLYPVETLISIYEQARDYE